MIAIDTNVVVRYLTGDHPKQSAKARVLIDGNDVFVSRTVMLETEWVLRSVYGLASPEVSRALRAFCGLARVSVENAPALSRALDLAEDGMDFADALHLLGSAECEALATFDRSFVKSARKAGMDNVREL